MEASVARRLPNSGWVDSKKIDKKTSLSVRFPRPGMEQLGHKVLLSASALPRGPSSRRKTISLEVSSSYKNFSASTLESGSFRAPFDEALLPLKKKSQEIEPYLNGRCIYLVGMMGSGKTTVGKILSQVLGYSFADSDTVVEQEVGTPVAEVFKHYGEGFFRDKETEALRRLSLMHRLVVSTGGGAVVRPINWKYMQKGISVWLDVPLEALAQRITAVGTGSRPLLHNESGDAYSKTFLRLCTIMEERSEAYAHANARVSLENIAAKLGLGDVSNLTPAAIAVEALEQIGNFLNSEGGYDLL